MENKKIKFSNYEELLRKYPIGSIISKRTVFIRRAIFSPDKKDEIILSQQYDKVERYNEFYCICSKTTEEKQLVEGYIYDGQFWYPAYNTWDGWCPYDESNFFLEAEVIKDSVDYSFLGVSSDGF